MSTNVITREQAEAALAAVIVHFHTYLEPMVFAADEDYPARTYPPECPLPTLRENFDGAPFAILWEEGPDEWAYRATMGGNSEEDRVLAAEVGVTVANEKPATFPAGVEAEPMTSFTFGLYPA